MTQQLFEELTADSPPSTVDLPGIIRREKRRRTLVRAGGSGAVLLAVVSAIAVLGPDRTPAPPVLASPSTAESAAPVVPGFRLVATDRAATAATAKTLRAALDAAVHKAAPGATWLTQGPAETATPNGQPPRVIGDDLKRPTDQMFWGQTGIALDGRRGTLSIGIASMNPCTGGRLAKCPPGSKDPETLRRDMATGLYACQPAPEKCTASIRPNGRRQRVQKMVSLGGFVSQETNVELADGRALMIFVDNQFRTPVPADKVFVPQPTTPLSPAQITAIATAIGDQILP
jgi:hypothetical protein